MITGRTRRRRTRTSPTTANPRAARTQPTKVHLGQLGTARIGDRNVRQYVARGKTGIQSMKQYLDDPALIEEAWDDWFATFLGSNVPPAYHREIYTGYQLVKATGATQMNSGNAFVSGSIPQMIGWGNLKANDQTLEFILFAINTVFTDLGTKSDPIDRILDTDGDGMYDQGLLTRIEDAGNKMSKNWGAAIGVNLHTYDVSTTTKSSDKLTGSRNITFSFLPGYIIDPDRVTPEMVEMNPSFASFRGYKVYRMGGETSFLQTGEINNGEILYRGTTPDTISVPILVGKTAILPLTGLSETKPASLKGITYDVSGSIGGTTYTGMRSSAGFEQVGFAQDGTPLYGFMVDTSRMMQDVVLNTGVGPHLLLVGLTGTTGPQLGKNFGAHLSDVKQFAQVGTGPNATAAKELMQKQPALFENIVRQVYNAYKAYRQAGGDRTDALSYGFQTSQEQHKAVMIGEPMTLRQIEAATPLRVQNVADRKTGLSSSTLTGTMTKSDIRSFVRGKTIFDISRFVRGAKSGGGYNPRGNHGTPTGDTITQVSPTATKAITNYLSGDEMSIPTPKDIQMNAMQALQIQPGDNTNYAELIKRLLNIK